MLTQLLNIKWDITDVMLFVIIILGAILFYKILEIVLGFFYNIRQSKNSFKKESIKKEINKKPFEIK